MGMRQLREAMVTVPEAASRKAAGNKSEMSAYQAGSRAAERAASREAEADEQRAKFVLALDDPRAAMGSGRAVKATLRRIEADYSFAESRYSRYLEFLDEIDDEHIEAHNDQLDQDNFSMRLP